MSRMIDDRRMDIGDGRKGSVFPENVKTKILRHSEGAGRMMDYPDTEELIHRDQEKGVSEIKKKKMKPGFRN